MDPTRRQALALGAAAAAFPATAASLPATPKPSLNALARRGGRRFGSAVGTGWPGRGGGAFADPRYRRIVEGECGLIVPENELKWSWVQPRPGVFDFAAADRLLGWASAHGMAMRGHNLVWHHPHWWPAWVTSHDFGARPASEAERLLTTHIDTVCRRYGARIASWDVINEAVDAGTGEMRETVFSRAMGGRPDDVLDLAFRTARAAVPHCQLVYNDYMSWEPGNEKHRAGVLRLLERLRKRGTPVDALGVQSHIGSGNNPGDPSIFGPHDEGAWRRFLDEVTGMGYQLLITEFDVNDRGIVGDAAARDRAVADYAKAYLDLMLSYRQLGDILAWGMTDDRSWLQERPGRADGRPKRPCPYDAQGRPKPLRAAIAAALAHAPSRHRA
ncbi:MAG: endo-1,4-beta-xylanase [Alphaproteobacteria bacterium]|nr:endo-1,4-beta-xylanase [Alphaproteobacteria bacterium]